MFVLFLLHASWLVAAPYYEGKMRVTFRDTARGRDIPVTIIYPSDGASGNDKPLVGTSTNTIPTFGVVVMGHGFQMPVTAYASFATNTCKTFGKYVVVLPETGSSLFPSHAEFAADMVSCAQYMQRENKRPGSIWYGHVANNTIMAGHSMGGGAAFLAAEDVLKNTSLDLTAVIGLAPAETNPSAKAAAASVTVPTLILAGGKDCVTPLAGTVQPIYDSVAASCKVLALIPGGGHCQFADENSACAFGEFNCRPTIGRTAQFDRSFRYINALIRGSDSVARAIDDTQIQTTMVFFTGNEITAESLVVCPGDTVRLRAKVPASLAPEHLLWQPGNIRGSTYTMVLRDTALRVTLTNTQCFSQTTASVTVRQHPAPTLVMDPPGDICPEGSLTLRARAEHAARIEWSTGEVGDSIRIASPGTYRATSVSRYGCGTVTDSVVVRPIVTPRVLVDQRGDTLICNGLGGMELTALYDAERYERVIWSNGQTGSPLVITKPGTYALSARVLPRDEADCVLRTDTVRFTLRSTDAPTPVVALRRDTLWSTPGVSYAWQVDADPIPGWNAQYLVPTRSGRYSVTVAYDGDGMCKATSEGLDVNLATSVADDSTPPPTILVGDGRVTVTGLTAGVRLRLVSLLGHVGAEYVADQTGTAAISTSTAHGIQFLVVGARNVVPILFAR
jgi:alpha-beta hydrolase superfamily lysophospholipase